MKNNRAARRKAAMMLVNQHVKQRAVTEAEKQKGFGLIVTNKMIAIIFWRWTWTPVDRRARA